MQILLDRPFEVSDLEKAEELDIRNISDKTFGAVLKARRCTFLSLYNLKVTDISGLEKLSSVRKLKINWATKIENIQVLGELSSLECLDLVDLPRLRDIGPLAQLGKLTELTLSGGMWKPIHLETLWPISKLNLKKLSITNIKLDDDDIKIVAAISTLSEFDVSNQFPRDQYAYLAGKLNNRIKTKIEAYRKSPVSCSKCNAEKVMFMGRRMPFLCKVCENGKVERLSIEFEEEKKKWLRD
jgi:hypothetical protein